MSETLARQLHAARRLRPKIDRFGPIKVMKITAFQTRVASPAKAADRASEPIAADLANFVIIELQTDAGLRGIGYAGFVMAKMLKPLKDTVDALAEQAIGDNPEEVEAISSRLLGFGGNGAPAGLVTSASAAIDTALWDIKAKAADLPLFRLLGGTSNRVPTYASGYLWRNYDATMLASTGERLVEQGFKAMKFRMGAEDSDIAEVTRMRAIREAVGDGIDLMVDINQGWDVNRSIRVGRAMEACGLYWLEDPIHHQDYKGLAQVADSLDTPVTTGEYHFGLAPFRHMLEQGCVDIVMVDLLRVGGITHWMKAAHLAEGFNKPVVSHLAPEVLAHCVTAVPNGLNAEHMPWALPLFQEAFSMEDGEIVLPDKPGLGLELDLKAIERLQPGP